MCHGWPHTRELTESGGTGFAPTNWNWNWTGQVGHKILPPWSYFHAVTWRLECIKWWNQIFFRGEGGVVITRAKLKNGFKMVSFVLFSFVLGVRLVSWIVLPTGTSLCLSHPLLPPLSVCNSPSKSGWPWRPNHLCSWYHQAGLTDDSACTFANETMLRPAAFFLIIS